MWIWILAASVGSVGAGVFLVLAVLAMRSFVRGEGRRRKLQQTHVIRFRPGGRTFHVAADGTRYADHAMPQSWYPPYSEPGYRNPITPADPQAELRRLRDEDNIPY